LWVLVQAHAIDREAFTFTNYNLDVRIEPEQQRLAVRGKIILRMISVAAEKPVTADFFRLDWRYSNSTATSPVHLQPIGRTSINTGRFGGDQ